MARKMFPFRVADWLMRRFSPVTIVLSIAMMTMMAVGAVRYYDRDESFDPHVNLAHSSGMNSARPLGAAARVNATSYGDSDPSVRYSDRLRDASALSIAFSLYSLNERLVNRRIPPDINSVLEGMKASGLMPPGLEVVNGVGVVRSPFGICYIRYRPLPYGVEVLSVGARGLADGEVFIIRVPEAEQPTAMPSPNDGKAYATIFTAPMSDAPVPPAFSSSTAFANAGWRQEPLRSAPYSQQQIEELQTWLANYQQTR